MERLIHRSQTFLLFTPTNSSAISTCGQYTTDGGLLSPLSQRASAEGSRTAFRMVDRNLGRPRGTRETCPRRGDTPGSYRSRKKHKPRDLGSVTQDPGRDRTSRTPAGSGVPDFLAATRGAVPVRKRGPVRMQHEGLRKRRRSSAQGSGTPPTATFQGESGWVRASLGQSGATRPGSGKPRPFQTCGRRG